ncbi:MAG: DUF1127 domain-containing protein [Thalassococcus sp.]|uniref:DUF1127 domain-containing protein n=1 Tax=Thalassococcus sp. TaxID=1928858 RepID=UPI001AFE4AAA|nr:DUF1127 domain-containing protein [Thalassococcus sp.]MBO6868802.1 DUF1127 domain-containing protein [Thalassococcus sp.]
MQDIRTRILPLPRSGQFFSQIVAMIRLARQRRALAALDDHQLRDIGLTPEDARQEAERLFWDVPNHWRG